MRASTLNKATSPLVIITKVFEKGELNLYTRQTGDRGIWYLPTPLNVEGIDANYTQIGPLNRQGTITYGPNDTAESFDFGEGRGWDDTLVAVALSLDVGNDWQLVDRFNQPRVKQIPHSYQWFCNDRCKVDNGESATGAVTGTMYDGDTPIQQIGRWL